MTPTLPTLATICRVYGVGLGFFFADAVKHSLSITRNLREIGRGRTREAPKEFMLNADSSLQAKEVEFPAGVVGVLAKVGETFRGVIYVREGSLKLDSSGICDVLEAGDCVCLDSEMLITWSANGKSRCRALVVTSR
jgi:hypothetical protein